MMKRVMMVLTGLLTMVTVAAAQPAAFVPFEVDQKFYNELISYLQEVPAKYANPLINALAEKEKQAQAAVQANKPEEKQSRAKGK